MALGVVAKDTPQMTMTRLFNDKGGWTDEARALDKETFEALQPIVRRYRESGHCMRDVQYVLAASAWDLTLSELLYDSGNRGTNTVLG